MLSFTGDEDNFWSSEIMNNYYLFSNGIEPIKHWNMTSTLISTLPGCENYSAKGIRKYGERLCLYHTIEFGTAKPQRVRYTAAGGITTPVPLKDDWRKTGSGSVDLEAVMGVDFIQVAEKLGNYIAIYGERTVALQDYTARVSQPFSFYTRVSGVGLAAPRAIANLGEEHIFMGWDDIYSYKGGKNADRIGGPIRRELFKMINPEYINRSFMVYIEETDEIRLYFPKVKAELPNCYFSLNLENYAWSRGSRSYTGYGYFSLVAAPTWENITPQVWEQQIRRWDDATTTALSPINLYGDSSGRLYKDDETINNLAGAAIDGYWDTKDFVTGEGYRRTMTNFMELNFEAKGDTLKLYYSTDFGTTWTFHKEYTLSNDWTMEGADFEVYSPQIRFRFRNSTLGQTFNLRNIEMGYVEASDRGV